MMRPLALCVIIFLAGPTYAEEAKPPILVPYRLTPTQHVLIRAKVNGKGPFNFILDTGAPALFMVTKVADKAGVEANRRGLSKVDRFEVEGGVVFENTQGRVEDIFQIEGMNGMGLAGVELPRRDRLQPACAIPHPIRLHQRQTRLEQAGIRPPANRPDGWSRGLGRARRAWLHDEIRRRADGHPAELRRRAAAFSAPSWSMTTATSR